MRNANDMPEKIVSLVRKQLHFNCIRKGMQSTNHEQYPAKKPFHPVSKGRLSILKKHYIYEIFVDTSEI